MNRNRQRKRYLTLCLISYCGDITCHDRADKHNWPKVRWAEAGHEGTDQPTRWYFRPLRSPTPSVYILTKALKHAHTPVQYHSKHQRSAKRTANVAIFILHYNLGSFSIDSRNCHQINTRLQFENAKKPSHIIATMKTASKCTTNSTLF